MPFTPPLQTERSIQQREDSTSSQGQIVIYQGRKLNQNDAFIQQLAPKFSFTDKMFFNIGRILEVDMSRISTFLPPGLAKMFGRIDEIFQAMEQPVNPSQDLFGFFLNKHLTLQEEIAREEEKEKNQLMLFGQMDGLIHQFGVQRQQQLLLAGVSSGKEFEEKKQKIAEYRALAEERYLQDPSHIEIRKKIDRNMILSYKGTLNKYDEKIIEEYWNYVTTDPEGRIKMAKVEARSMELFGTSLFDNLNSMMEKMQLDETKEKLKPSQFIVKAFNQVSFNTYQQLEEEKDQCKSKEEELLMEYLMLKNGPLMSTILKMQLRQQLNSQLEAAEQAAEAWIKFSNKQQQSLIDYYQDQVQKYKKEIQKQDAILASYENKPDQKGENEKPSNWKVDMAKRMHKLATKNLKSSQSELEKALMEQEDKTFFKRSAYDIMESEGRENPDEIRAYIPVKTCFDRQVIESINLEEETAPQEDGLNPSWFSVPSDMQLDLNQLEDPVEYFYQEIIKIDQKKLKIFEPKIVNLDSKTE